MKIGVIKLGSRIVAGGGRGAVAPGEAISICKALVRGGAEVHIFTSILESDEKLPQFVWHQILEDRNTSDLDALLVINGNVNYYGGQDDPAQTTNYAIINSFKGKVVYVMCDPELPLMQIWENVSKKEWGSAYREKDVLITRKDIHVLSQSFDLNAMKKYWPKKAVEVASFFHFPMDRFPMLNEWLKPAKEPVVDLLYGGTHRGGRRIPNLYKWYCNLPDDISVEIFGSIDDTDFLKHPKIGLLTAGQELMHLKHGSPPLRFPTFTGKVKYSEVLPKMNNALAHLVTGDPSYETLDLIPQRVAECFAAGNIVFVDAGIDKSRRIYPVGSMAHDFLYVDTQAELIERLRIVKADVGIRNDLLYAQKIATNFNADEFCQSLVKTVEAL